MRRLIAILLILCLLPAAAMAAPPNKLRKCQTVEDIETFLLLPQRKTIPAVEKGRIRYISTNDKDPAFCKDYWVSEHYNLSVKSDSEGKTFKTSYQHMLDRACYCMALNYLGIDVTPAMMSELANQRDLTAPFDVVTRCFPQIKRVSYAQVHSSSEFDQMVRNYLASDAYSPVYVSLKKPNGALYTVMITGFIESTGGFIIVDPAGPTLQGNMRVYKMAFHVMRKAVLSSAFYDEFYESEVLAVYQWRLNVN